MNMCKGGSLELLLVGANDPGCISFVDTHTGKVCVDAPLISTAVSAAPCKCFSEHESGRSQCDSDDLPQTKTCVAQARMKWIVTYRDGMGQVVCVGRQAADDASGADVCAKSQGHDHVVHNERPEKWLGTLPDEAFQATSDRIFDCGKESFTGCILLDESHVLVGCRDNMVHLWHYSL
jgi:hypothetical protein